MLLKSFRYLLIPFALLYGAVIWFRNRMFDKNILKSSSFNFPIICIGNLSVGGTGKTPMVEYLIRLLKNDLHVATLSRGYKRKTKGFAIADTGTTALEIGDEPMQLHCKFPEITVAVGEERLVAIPQLLQERPETAVILLDDAFQHRSVRAGLNILLTDYKNLYTRDLLLPAGDLRDLRSGSRRAHIILVTKCIPGLSEPEKKAIITEIGPSQDQTVYFTEIEYGRPYHLFSKKEIIVTDDMDTLLICAIASPGPLKEFLNRKVNTYDMLRYPDHHIFDMDDLEDIKKQFGKMRSVNKIIFTTEKDAVRLQKFENELLDHPIYVIPILHRFLFNEGADFDAQVQTFILGYSTINPEMSTEIKPGQS